MTTRKPRFTERLTLPVRPRMRKDVERIAAELDVPATEILRDWLEECIERHGKAKTGKKR